VDSPRFTSFERRLGEGREARLFRNLPQERFEKRR